MMSAAIEPASKGFASGCQSRAGATRGAPFRPHARIDVERRLLRGRSDPGSDAHPCSVSRHRSRQRRHPSFPSPHRSRHRSAPIFPVAARIATSIGTHRFRRGTDRGLTIATSKACRHASSGCAASSRWARRRTRWVRVNVARVGPLSRRVRVVVARGSRGSRAGVGLCQFWLADSSDRCRPLRGAWRDGTSTRPRCRSKNRHRGDWRFPRDFAAPHVRGRPRLQQRGPLPPDARVVVATVGAPCGAAFSTPTECDARVGLTCVAGACEPVPGLGDACDASSTIPCELGLVCGGIAI